MIGGIWSSNTPDLGNVLPQEEVQIMQDDDQIIAISTKQDQLR
jgi:hypothetical protein